MSAWQPGQSGNPEGSRKPFRDALKRALARAEADGNFKDLNKLADALIAKAAEGDIPALKEVADRLDGKPAQAVHVANEDGVPFRQINEFVDRIVDPRDPSTAGLQAAVTARDLQGR